jgi:biopolymer transport protein ExbB/TolQ
MPPTNRSRCCRSIKPNWTDTLAGCATPALTVAIPISQHTQKAHQHDGVRKAQGAAEFDPQRQWSSPKTGCIKLETAVIKLGRSGQSRQANRSVSEAIGIGTASLELFQHEIDRRYSMVRYRIRVLPTLGFLGTVLGISQALRFAGAANPPDLTLLQEFTQILAVKFDTTLIALSLAAVLVLAQHLVQRYEEALNAAGQCCIANFINRLLNE